MSVVRNGVVRVCSEERPSPGSYWKNLREPMPLHKKARLIARNIFARFLPKPATCCGHPGEPGC